MTRVPSTKSRTEPDQGRRGPDNPLAIMQYVRQFVQGRAAAGGDHQFGRVVADDAPVRARVEHFAGDDAPQERLAVGTLNAQRRGVLQRLVDLFQQGAAVIHIVFAKHQKRSSSGKGICPM